MKAGVTDVVLTVLQDSYPWYGSISIARDHADVLGRTG